MFKKFFFWPKLRVSIHNFINDCRTYSIIKPKFVPFKCTHMLTESPMDGLAINFVVIDCYSRYPFAFPVQEQMYNV